MLERGAENAHHEARRRESIAARTTHFLPVETPASARFFLRRASRDLRIVLERLGDMEVHDLPDVGLVDPHSEPSHARISSPPRPQTP